MGGKNTNYVWVSSLEMPLVVLKYTASPIPSLINHRCTPSTQVFSRACWGSTLGGESNQVLQEVRGAALAFLSRSVRTLCKPTAPLLLCMWVQFSLFRANPEPPSLTPGRLLLCAGDTCIGPGTTDYTSQSGRLLGMTFPLVGKQTMLNFHSKLLAMGVPESLRETLSSLSSLLLKSLSWS